MERCLYITLDLDDKGDSTVYHGVVVTDGASEFFRLNSGSFIDDYRLAFTKAKQISGGHIILLSDRLLNFPRKTHRRRRTKYNEKKSG